jgi:hypothetical protein
MPGVFTTQKISCFHDAKNHLFLRRLTHWRLRQGCQIFLGTIIQNGGKYTKAPLNCRMGITYTKITSSISNGYRIYQPLQFRGPPKVTHFGNFGLKVNHLATLVYATSSSETLLPLLKN